MRRLFLSDLFLEEYRGWQQESVRELIPTVAWLHLSCPAGAGCTPHVSSFWTFLVFPHGKQAVSPDAASTKLVSACSTIWGTSGFDYATFSALLALQKPTPLISKAGASRALIPACWLMSRWVSFLWFLP